MVLASQVKLLDQLRAVLRRKHYSRRTEESYVAWVTRFIRFIRFAILVISAQPRLPPS